MSTAYASLQTVGSLLLTNSDFRIFMGDMGTIGKQIFSDTAFSLSNTAEEVAKQIAPDAQEAKKLEGPGADQGPPPSTDELQAGTVDVAAAVVNGADKTAKDAVKSAEEHLLSGDTKDTLINRLKQAILKLRKRPDYEDSVSTIGLLIQQYAQSYSRAVDDTLTDVSKDIKTNDSVDRAVKNFWSLMISFGDPDEWDTLQHCIDQVMTHAKKDPEFENLMNDVGNSVQKLLTDPSFLDHADEKIQDLQKKSKQTGTAESSLRSDVDALIAQIQRTFSSVIQDKDISALVTTTSRILSIISPTDSTTNSELINDSLQIFIPALINLVQYIPIPRLEVSTPDIDILLENLIIEPGRTINHSSFLPYRLRLETLNTLDVRKFHVQTTSKVTSLATIRIDGLSLRADELGFWMRAHSGILRLADEGIASFALDDRGIDVALEVEIGRERLEQLLTLKKVKVRVHELDYALRKSKFAWLAWLVKPLLRPVLRAVMERQLAAAIADLLHAANRELLFARERLRATRIADPKDLATFVRAVLARLVPEEDPDVYTSVGVRPSGHEVFRGRYAPGSVVKLWEEEARLAGERIEDFEVEGWRNGIFDVNVRAEAA